MLALLNNLKKILIVFIISILLLILIEFFSRVFIYFIVRDSTIFKYGFNKNLYFKTINLSNLKFSMFINEDKINEKKINEKKINEKKGNLIKIYAFGGSTTEGNEPNCGHSTSSWPDQMALLNNKYKIVNLGKKGNNSSYSLNRLLSLKDDNINVILWANKYNEEYHNYENKKLLLLRITKTLEKNLLFFYLSKDFFERINYKFYGYKEPLYNQKTLSYQDAANIYKLNTIAAYSFAKYNNIDFYIVDLFGKYNFENKKFFTKEFYNEFNLVINQLKNEYNIKVINTESYAKNYLEKIDNVFKNSNIYFCDDIHQTLEGNILTAEAILYYLNNQ